jgi:uracil-DNA glycosylase
VDRAKSLASLEAVAERRAALARPHMQALVAFVQRLRDMAPAGVPDFDPFDGGNEAECLFLLEAPGAKAVGSGFISRNNPDETASNFFAANTEAGLPRSRTVTWNAVPWYIGSGTRIRAATGRDLRDAERHLEELFGLLPRLKVVVLVGRKAQRFNASISRLAPSVHILSCSHPSPLSFNGRPERRAEMLACLRRVSELLGPRSGVLSNPSIERTA